MTATRRRWTLIAVALATFMTYLDNNIINVALPTVQRQLQLSVAGLEWVVSAYILVFAGLLLVGGRLADAFGRRRLFLIGLAIFTTLALGAWAIPESREQVARRLDLPGLATSATALFCLTYALVEGPRLGWSAPIIVGSLALAALAGVGFALVEARTTDPMVAVALFGNRVFAGGSAALMMWAFGLFGIYFFTSLYLQDVLGFSPTKAGLAFVPMALLIAIGAVASERAARLFGAHRSVAAAMLVMAGGIASVGLLGKSASFAELMPSFALIGIGGGLTTPLTATVLAVMPSEQAGVASGIFNASREVAGLLGITIIGAILSARQGVEARHGHDPTTAFLSGYQIGLIVAAVLVAAGGLAAWTALRHTPHPQPAVRDTTGAQPRSKQAIPPPVLEVLTDAATAPPAA